MLPPQSIKENIANAKSIGQWWQQHPHQVSVMYMLCCILVLGWIALQVMQEKNREIQRLNNKIEKYEQVLIPQLNGLEPKIKKLEEKVNTIPSADTIPIPSTLKNNDYEHR